MRVLAIEPYYGGSHRAFLDGFRAHSRHRAELLTMPARKWKWRMRGAAMLAAHTLEGDPPDAILASDYLDLATFLGLRRETFGSVPCAVYFHENQLTYPLPREEERDYHYGFTNITACLAAERVIFNSRYHMDSFLGAVGGLLRRMPDCVPEGVTERIRARACVVPVGVELDEIDRLRSAAAPRSGPLRVLWNHRWEFDKGPEGFVEVAERLEGEGCDFELVVLGQSFRARPEAFDRIRCALGHRLRHFGYVESRRDYLLRLLECDVVVSTALHEFFGVAVVEAVYAGCVPLLPNRLSYPELLPRELHRSCLYETSEELFERLRRYAQRPELARSQDVRGAVARFGWRHVAPQLDGLMCEMASRQRRG